MIEPAPFRLCLGIPIIGWLIWWKFFEGSGEKTFTQGKLVLAKSTIALNRIKKQIAKSGFRISDSGDSIPYSPYPA